MAFRHLVSIFGDELWDKERAYAREEYRALNPRAKVGDDETRWPKDYVYKQYPAMSSITAIPDSLMEFYLDQGATCTDYGYRRIMAAYTPYGIKRRVVLYQMMIEKTKTRKEAFEILKDARQDPHLHKFLKDKLAEYVWNFHPPLKKATDSIFIRKLRKAKSVEELEAIKVEIKKNRYLTPFNKGDLINNANIIIEDIRLGRHFYEGE